LDAGDVGKRIAAELEFRELRIKVRVVRPFSWALVVLAGEGEDLSLESCEIATRGDVRTIDDVDE